MGPPDVKTMDLRTLILPHHHLWYTNAPPQMTIYHPEGGDHERPAAHHAAHPRPGRIRG
jgi:hypothetical protein